MSIFPNVRFRWKADIQNIPQEVQNLPDFVIPPRSFSSSIWCPCQLKEVSHAYKLHVILLTWQSCGNWSRLHL